MQTFEVSELRGIASANKRFKASSNKRTCSTAEHCLLAKEVGLRFLTESGFEDTGACAANSFRPSQSRSLGVPARVLMNRDQRRRAASPEELPTHHRPQTFGRDHHNIHIFPRDERTVINCKAVREKKGLPRAQTGSDLFFIDCGHFCV